MKNKDGVDCNSLRSLIAFVTKDMDTQFTTQEVKDKIIDLKSKASSGTGAIPRRRYYSNYCIAGLLPGLGFVVISKRNNLSYWKRKVK